MINRNHPISKRVVGVALVLVSTLIVLGYSTLGNLQSANAVVSLQPPPPPGNSPQTVDLKHAPHGTAQLTWDAKVQKLTVNIHMGGLAPDSSHPADIDKGSCETTNGGLIYTLNPVAPPTNQAGGQSSPNSAGSAGPVTNFSNVSPPTLPPGGQSSTSSKPARKGNSDESTSKTKLPLTTGIPKSGWFINIHNGSTDPTPISCGDILNFDPSLATNQFVDVTLGPSNNPNQAANGIATLSVANNQLTVTITISGLVPGSTNQAHIHQGSCTSQGPVLFPLNPVVADKNGTGTSTKVIPNVASIPPKGWYVNVHLGAQQQDLNTPTGFDPLVCGNV